MSGRLLSAGLLVLLWFAASHMPLSVYARGLSYSTAKMKDELSMQFGITSWRMNGDNNEWFSERMTYKLAVVFNANSERSGVVTMMETETADKTTIEESLFYCRKVSSIVSTSTGDKERMEGNIITALNTRRTSSQIVNNVRFSVTPSITTSQGVEFLLLSCQIEPAG